MKPAFIDPLDPEYLSMARHLIALYASHQGRKRGGVESSLRAYEAYKTDYKIVRGLAELLEENQRARFVKVSPVDPLVLRRCIYSLAARSYPIVAEPDLVYRTTRHGVLEQAAREFSLTMDEVQAAMYTDLEENQILVEFDANIDPERLLHRYNLALAQGILYYAKEMRFYVASHYKTIFKFIKNRRLMHTISPAHAGGYLVKIDGRYSIFRHTILYGLEMARVLPALLLCPRWHLEADIDLSGYGFEGCLRLNHLSGLKTHYQEEREFDSRWEEGFAIKFEKSFGRSKKRDWVLRREDEIIDLKGSVLIPDFSLTHKDGRRALLEIVGFWTPQYLQRKMEKLCRAERNDIVIAVSKKLVCSVEDFSELRGELLFFSGNAPRINEVLERAERCAVK